MIRDKVAERFKRNIASSIANGIIILIIGIFMLVFPNLTKRIISYMLGALLLFNSLISIMKYTSRKGAKLYSFNLLFGLICLFFGVIMLVSPNLVFNHLVICLGLYLIILGAIKISYGIWFKIGSDDSWLITITVGVMLIIFGFILLSNPFEATLTITQIMGTFLILTAVVEITSNILLYKRTKDITKIFW